MLEFLNAARALGDEGRLRILMALRQRPLCVCEVTELLGLAPSTTSKHLFLLRQAGLIESVKKGRWVYYRLPQKPSNCVHAALDWATKALASDERILRDAAALPNIVLGEEAHHFHDTQLHELCRNDSEEHVTVATTAHEEKANV